MRLLDTSVWLDMASRRDGRLGARRRHGRSKGSLQFSDGRGCGIRTREGLSPRRFPSLWMGVRSRSPNAATWAVAVSWPVACHRNNVEGDAHPRQWLGRPSPATCRPNPWITTRRWRGNSKTEQPSRLRLAELAPTRPAPPERSEISTYSARSVPELSAGQQRPCGGRSRTSAPSVVSRGGGDGIGVSGALVSSIRSSSPPGRRG
jgi:hypothetical protein